MIFDGTINLGTILNTVAMLFGGLYFMWSMNSRLMLLIQETTMRHAENVKEFGTLKSDIVTVNTHLNKLSDITIELTKQEVRMSTFDQRLLELSNRIHAQVVRDNSNNRAKAKA